MAKYYVGLDIGASGGVVILDSSGKVVEVFKTPETRYEFRERFEKYSEHHCMCILEKVHSQPKNGGKANFTFGQTSERALYTLEVSKIAYQEVTPQTWMKQFMMKKDKAETNTQWKNRLKERAQQLFPHEKVTLWNADAFLISLFCYTNYK